MKCPECGKRFRGNFCPECGWKTMAGPEYQDTRKSPFGKKLLALLCIVLVCVVVAQSYSISQLAAERDEYEAMYQDALNELVGYSSMKDENRRLRNTVEAMRDKLQEFTGLPMYFQEEFS